MLHGIVWRVLSVSFLTAVALAQQTITFQFSPPDGTAFVERDRKIVQVTVGGEKVSEEVTEAKCRYVIRKVPNGYSVQMEPMNPDLKSASDVQALVRSMLAHLAVTADLDQRGRLVRMRGVNAAMAQVKEIIPKEVYEVVISQFGGKTPEQIAVQTWNDRGMLGAMTGMSLQLGTAEERRLPVPLPTGGAVDADISLAVTALQPCHSYRCAQVRITEQSDDPRFASQFNDLIRAMMLGIASAMESPNSGGRQAADDVTSKVNQLLSRFRFSNVRFSVVDERLVDPATGLLYSESSTKTTQGVMHIDQEQERMTYSEIHEYHFTYE